MEVTPQLLRLEGVSKRYGGVRALEDARLQVARGRIHAVLGENGAGKSTLLKVMLGVVEPDTGTLELDGTQMTLGSPAAARRARIVGVFQELSLLPDLSVADNIGIVQPPTRFGLIDRRAQRRLAEAALARVGATDINPLAPVASLSLSRRQLVEIARALAQKPRVLLLDEASSALSARDVAQLFRVLRELRDEGVAIVYISHRMSEIAELSDDCSVYRNGRHIATFAAGSKSPDEIIELMIGRDYESIFPQRTPRAARSAVPALKVQGLSWAGRLQAIDFELGPGEVVGLGGLDGQGQRDLLAALFGVLRGVSGSVEMDGQAVSLSSPRSTRHADGGIALIPEDRRREGLMLPMSVRENLTLAALDQHSRWGWIEPSAERRAVEQMLDRLQIRCDGIEQPVASLSGGNQQKVVIGKWLMTHPRIILLNDPTRGIDVGTKQQLYRLFRELADSGAAILLYSTDYDELMGCCERVLVMYEGAIVRSFGGDELNERNLVAAAHNLSLATQEERPT
jgi:ribose transport system ATP-binding protein